MTLTKKQTNLRGGGLKAVLLRGGISSIFLRILINILSLSMAVILARTLGASGYGIYAYAMAVATLLAIPAQVGLPTIVVRETARAEASENWGMIRGLWQWANKIVILVSLLLILLAALVFLGTAEHYSESQLVTLYLSLALVPLMALGNLRGAALRGLRRVIQGQLPESVFRPFFLVMFIVATHWYAKESLTPQIAMVQHGLAAVLAFMLGAVMLHFARPAKLKEGPVPQFDRGAWKKSILPLSMIAGANVINAQADIIMLGWFVSDSEVGVYRVVASSVLLINFGKQAIVSVITPHFARLYSRGEMGKLQKLVTRSNQAIFAFSLPAFIVFLFYGDRLLGLAFGSEFVGGYYALCIMSFGYLIGMAFGSVAALLNMAGFERYTASGVAISAVLNIILNALLIPKWGIEGAASAMTLSMAFSSLFLWFSARKKVGISSGFIGGLCK